MRVLIVESNPQLGQLWQRHIARLGCEVDLAATERDAESRLELSRFDVVVMDLALEKGAALPLADVISYRSPQTRVVFVSKDSFFSDGSIFGLIGNAAAHLSADSPPGDLAAVVQYHGRHAQA